MIYISKAKNIPAKQVSKPVETIGPKQILQYVKYRFYNLAEILLSWISQHVCI